MKVSFIVNMAATLKSFVFTLSHGLIPTLNAIPLENQLWCHTL